MQCHLLDLGPIRCPTTDRPDGLIRIIAAHVNDIQSPEQETITLLNRSNREVSLNGWKIADKQKNKMPLDGTVGPGATKTITIARSCIAIKQGRNYHLAQREWT